jgi:hypothetical protein
LLRLWEGTRGKEKDKNAKTKLGIYPEPFQPIFPIPRSVLIGDFVNKFCYFQI